MGEKNDGTWFKSICLEENEIYVELLLSKFGIKEYNIMYNNGALSLMFKYRMDSYRCDIDKDNKQMILMKRNLCGNSRKDKFHRVCEFDGLDIWYEMLRFVTKVR